MPSLHRVRRSMTVVLLVVAVAAVGCSSSEGSDTVSSTAEATATTTTTPGAGTSTVPVDAGPLAPAVEPVEVAEGYRALRSPGIGVGVAVPQDWTVTDLRGDDLTVAQAEAAARDPQLSGLLAEGGALLDQAQTLVAIGPVGSGGTPLVTLIQLGAVVDGVSSEMEEEVRAQVEGYGASDVAVARVDVPGLAAGVQALEVRAVLSLGGVEQQLVVRVVPATLGLAVITVRAESTALDSILRSLAAA